MSQTRFKLFNLIALFAGLIFSMNTAFANYRPSIEGFWSHDNRPARITMTGPNQLLFCNEEHSCASGYFVNKRLVRVPNWQVEGMLADHGRRIIWSNGTNWFKNSRLFSGRNRVNGQWKSEWKANSY